MDDERAPVVFISYCWTSEEHKKWVLDLATKLMEKSGVDVILDRWHGIVGHDRFRFMEDSIKKADKVLVICDERYCQKANNREGGVGTETLIITPDVYQSVNQEKFIPIALNKQTNGDYFLPIYFSSRFALGMINQSDFEKDYSQLERLIWQEPQIKPPVRGKKPNFESEKEVKELVDTRQILDVGHYDERVVWLLPRGFLLYRDITFNESSSWSCTVTYYEYDGTWQHGTHYHKSYSDSWNSDIELQYRKLSIPRGDWLWCRAPLNFLQELRAVDQPIDIKHEVEMFSEQVFYYAIGEEIPLPVVPDEYAFYFKSGDLRDLAEEIDQAVKTTPTKQIQEVHTWIVSIRQSTYINSLYFLGKDHPSLGFIKEIIDEYKQAFTKIEVITWLEKLKRILTNTLNHEWDTWKKRL